MLDLKDREWLPFYFSKIFTQIQRGKRLKTADHINGNVPYVSASTTNNGVDGFISNLTGVRIFNNCLTIVNIGNVGKSLYHNYEFVASDNVTALKNPAINRYVYLFLVPIVSWLEEKYDYGRIINDIRINKEIMLLPATADGNPDWRFMEDYIREREQRLVQHYIDHAKQILCECEVGEVVPLKDKEWREFVLNDIFTTIQRGKRLKTVDHKKGHTPYVSSTAFDNGVDAFISNRNDVRRFDNCLTIANSGSVGKTFYHPYELVASDHVTQLKNQKFSQYVYLFLIPIISRLEEKYSFNREMNDLRIRKDKILLPIDDNGDPDWAYMEQYAKMIMGQQLQANLAQNETT